jgi:hypothetical protein
MLNLNKQTFLKLKNKIKCDFSLAFYNITYLQNMGTITHYSFNFCSLSAPPPDTSQTYLNGKLTFHESWKVYVGTRACVQSNFDNIRTDKHRDAPFAFLGGLS